ncbi:Uncharacterized protein APZ42_024352 [Daphnia magna]|uniref:Uncharacterized protein n=1 Tax=Daphnia magna TaxID=35525 RepID=A0A164U3P3_9CRUS|nr:Uncharacterized protein APZ42_024352 [Daphnia magna]
MERRRQKGSPHKTEKNDFMMMMKDRVTKNQIDFSRWTTSSFPIGRDTMLYTPLL